MPLKKDFKYILILVVTVSILVAVEMLTPKPTNWTVTLSKKDKIPFGTYVLKKLYEKSTPQKNITDTYNTIYEILENKEERSDFLIIAESFRPDKEDTQKLLQSVYEGSNAFISANHFTGPFADTLKLEVSDYYLENALESVQENEDSLNFFFTNPTLSKYEYRYKLSEVSYYLESIDTARSLILANNSNNKVISAITHHGKGKIIVNTTPLAFTNNYLLHGDNSKFASHSLSYLENDFIYWTEYYQLGRMESSTPLRFILSQPALHWAYAITIMSLLLFVIFEAKRKQRIIPIIKPLQNTSLEFVKTVGNLYFNNSNHKNIAEKKILFFTENLKSKFYISNMKNDEDFYNTIASKSDKTTEEVKSLFSFFRQIQQKKTVSKNELMALNKKIEDFYN